MSGLAPECWRARKTARIPVVALAAFRMYSVGSAHKEGPAPGQPRLPGTIGSHKTGMPGKRVLRLVAEYLAIASTRYPFAWTI